MSVSTPIKIKYTDLYILNKNYRCIQVGIRKLYTKHIIHFNTWNDFSILLMLLYSLLFFSISSFEF